MQLYLEVTCNTGMPSAVHAKVCESALEKLNEKVNESDYIEKADEKTLNVRSIFAPEKRVPDVWRYMLRNTIGYISLREHSGAIEAVCQEKNKYRDLAAEEIDEPGTAIVLLLEYPHKDEFDNNDNPIAPAQGTTGRKIHEQLEHLVNLERRRFDFITSEASLIICNPIPFQTSLHMIHKGNIKSEEKLKDDIWKALWEENCIKENFKRRLESYKPSLIINACTGGKAKEGPNASVTCFLKSIDACEVICRTDHPSSWNIPKLQSA